MVAITVAVILHRADTHPFLGVLHDRHEIFLFGAPSIERVDDQWDLVVFETLARPLGLGIYLALGSYRHPHYLEIYDPEVGRVQNEDDEPVETPLLFADDPEGYAGGSPFIQPAEHIDLGRIAATIAARG